MKVKVSKEELRECVRNAVERVIKEGKNGKKWNGKTQSDMRDDNSKHERSKLSKRFQKDNKGNKGNFSKNLDFYDDEDIY